MVSNPPPPTSGARAQVCMHRSLMPSETRCSFCSEKEAKGQNFHVHSYTPMLGSAGPPGVISNAVCSPSVPKTQPLPRPKRGQSRFGRTATEGCIGNIPELGISCGLLDLCHVSLQARHGCAMHVASHSLIIPTPPPSPPSGLFPTRSSLKVFCSGNTCQSYSVHPTASYPPAIISASIQTMSSAGCPQCSSCHNSGASSFPCFKPVQDTCTPCERCFDTNSTHTTQATDSLAPEPASTATSTHVELTAIGTQGETITEQYRSEPKPPTRRERLASIPEGSDEEASLRDVNNHTSGAGRASS